MIERVLVAMPMKAFDQSKSRLAEVMTCDQRERLVTALFLNTQRFFGSHFASFDRLVVTPSQDVCELASRAGAYTLLEPSAEGMNRASQRAVSWAMDHNYSSVLLIPGDVPVWVRSEVDVLLRHGRQYSVVIAQAHDGGTNALLLRLPTPFRCCYGLNSSIAHQNRAFSDGLSTIVCKQPFLARDLDVPADCAILASRQKLPLLERL